MTQGVLLTAGLQVRVMVMIRGSLKEKKLKRLDKQSTICKYIEVHTSEWMMYKHMGKTGINKTNPDR